MERGLRTVNRQVSELVSAGYLKSERHGHGNHYILRDLAQKVAYRTASGENLWIPVLLAYQIRQIGVSRRSRSLLVKFRT